LARVQQQFEAFHDAIKLGRFDENETLREKRDIIRKKLNDRLPEVFKKYGVVCPTFRFRNQGSYEMDTGIKPLTGDFDIDLKKRVYEALVGHTKEVRIRRSCVTVFYQRQGEALYHVDLAIYSDGFQNVDGKSRLAKGKENSSTSYRFWEESDPQGFSDTVLNRFSGNDRAQFRRVVRYFKRWKDENFPIDGNAAPRGIGLTVAVYDSLQSTYFDLVAGTPDDLGALRKLLPAILARFTSTWDDTERKFVRRLVVRRPVEPRSDLFASMSAKHMEEFEGRLKELRDALDAAAQAVDPVEACKKLRQVFGRDFPVPEKEQTAKLHAPAIISSSSSA
jgi:hypothetical protein